MKTKSYFISIIIITVCSLYTCKKQKTNSNAIVHHDDDLNSGPFGGPLQLNSAKELDRQLRQLAEALAGLVQNDNINKYGDENLMSILVSNMPHGENELGVINFHDKVNTTGGSSVYKFKTSGIGSAPNTNDLHTALVKSSTLHSECRKQLAACSEWAGSSCRSLGAGLCCFCRGRRGRAGLTRRSCRA